MLHDVVLLVENIITDTSEVSVLQISIEVDLNNTIADGIQILLLGRSGSTVEDQEDWLILLCSNSILDVLLVLAEELWVKLDVSWLVDTVDVTETSSDREVWGDWGKSLVDGKDILGLGVERVVVNIFVVNTILLTASDTDFLWTKLILTSFNGCRELTISSHCFMGAARFKYLAVVWMFQSTSSSLRSIMWLEKRGSPCSLKYFSSASSIPSSHGRSFLALCSSQHCTF